MPFLLSLVIAYILGSISSASIIGRAFSYPEIKNEPDGRISASAVHQNAGLLPFAIVVFMDISLAAAAVFIAEAITHSSTAMVFAGFAAVIGHNWSIFLKFKGGLGATAILGVLIAIISWQVIPGLVIAGLLQIFTHKSGMSTIIGLGIMTATAFVIEGPGLVAVSPLMLFVLMVLKKFQVARITNPVH